MVIGASGPRDGDRVSYGLEAHPPSARHAAQSLGETFDRAIFGDRSTGATAPSLPIPDHEMASRTPTPPQLRATALLLCNSKSPPPLPPRCRRRQWSANAVQNGVFHDDRRHAVLFFQESFILVVLSCRLRPPVPWRVESLPSSGGCVRRSSFHLSYFIRHPLRRQRP